MRARWRLLAVIGLFGACQARTESAAKPTTTASVSAVPQPPAPPAPSSIPAPRASPRVSHWLERVGAKVPSRTSYVHQLPKAGKPSRLAFTAGLLAIDVSGGVWRRSSLASRMQQHLRPRVRTQEERAQDELTQDELIGRVPAADVTRMRGLATAAVGKPLAQLLNGGCDDCGGTTYAAHHLPGTTEPLVLTSYGPMGTHVREAPSVEPVIGWMSAVADRMLPGERARPFDLELPIVDQLSEPASPSQQPGETLFELERYYGKTVGVLVDRRGDVYRYLQHGDEPRQWRRVGHIGAAALARRTAQAERATQEPLIEVARGRFCTTVRWAARAGGELTPLSNDCEGRHGGAQADAIIAWIYAIDEQAAPVSESGWPRPG